MISAQADIDFRRPMKKTSSGFPRRSTRENISIDVSITNVGLILMIDPEKYPSSRRKLGILIWKHVKTKNFQLKVQN